MLAPLKNEFLYNNFRRQLGYFLLGFLVLSGFIFQSFIKPGLDTWKIENIKQNALSREVWAVPDGEKISFLTLGEQLSAIAAETKNAIKIQEHSPGSIALVLAGDYDSVLSFIQEMEGLEVPPAIEKLQIEKRKNIRAQMVLLY